MQPWDSTPGFQLDTHIYLPKYGGQMQGELLDSWIRSVTAY